MRVVGVIIFLRQYTTGMSTSEPTKVSYRSYSSVKKENAHAIYWITLGQIPVFLPMFLFHISYNFLFVT